MLYFYDGQIKRIIAQFMRVFSGFQWKSVTGELKTVPVSYGDISRQVAHIIKENSENKMPTVPKISCYMTDLEMDRKRLADATFVSKVNIRERRYTEDETGNRTYQNIQGGNYTVERLMPTPFTLHMKTDIWTSNIEQKLQLFEQIIVLFNPSLEIQANDNFLDWSSLSVVNLKSISPSSKMIPQGIETEIDVLSMAFDMPIWISPPAKVKKLGIIQKIITNVFTEDNQIDIIDELIEDQTPGTFQVVTESHRVLLLKSQNDNLFQYDLTIIRDHNNLDFTAKTETANIEDWHRYINLRGGWKPGSQIIFKLPNGYELIGVFYYNDLEADKLVVEFDPETLPKNTLFDSNGNIKGFDSNGNIIETGSFDENTASGFIDAIIDPLKYNPIEVYRKKENIPIGLRLLILNDIGSKENEDGPDAWGEYPRNTPLSDKFKKSDGIFLSESIIEYDGEKWNLIFDPSKEYDIPIFIQNTNTMIKYRWDVQSATWLKAFEGIYEPKSWSMILR